MPSHNIKTCKDGFKSVEFCANCGVEGQDLYSLCSYIGKLRCADCGHLKHVDEDCSHCKQFRKKFKEAIDKYNRQN